MKSKKITSIPCCLFRMLVLENAVRDQFETDVHAELNQQPPPNRYTTHLPVFSKKY